jgi:hypothetical protein
MCTKKNSNYLPSVLGSKVEGMITYVPGLNLNLAVTSRRLTNAFGFPVLKLYRKKSVSRGNGVSSGFSTR